ncbi:830_t:CDS:10 [Funneliformis geosporum]|uniref:830_t:CDS:1 n=1 Tax=Funneliformis geosporum TaxID=1117311 RepID=A0A9W4SN82_9GLOM|nr:830_t:CDS:10 [Funneliformis geosporum]
MKFGKSLGRTIEDIPSEWRPFIIQYKTLKRCIHKIVQELNDKGISRDILKTMLDAAEGYKMEYSFEANPIQIRPYIILNLDAYEHSPDFQHFLETTHTECTRCVSGSVSSLLSLPSTDLSDTETISDPHDNVTDIISNDSISPHPESTYIELETDGEFFNTLFEEISQFKHLQRQKQDEFVNSMDRLREILIDVTSPYKSDIYIWREVFQFYLQAEIFFGNTESDRNERSYENAQDQFNWFTRKFLLNSSREAFHEFLRINNDLIAMKHFQSLNETAMSKILKKHDKQTCLAASPSFEKLLENDPYITENMFKSLCFTMNNQLSTIIPQPEDHTCPICTLIYWKPIRLCCGHVFCITCLIQAERKGMRNCPICRYGDAIYKANSSNLDKPLRNFLKLYFPKEVKAKQKEADKAEVQEEMEILAIRSGSGQQSVTGLPNADDPDSLWIIKGAHGESCLRGEAIKCGSIIRLQHSSSGKLLHSHYHHSPISKQQEVSAFDGFDTGDNWKLTCLNKSSIYWLREQKVQFMHLETSSYLSANKDYIYNNPIHGQIEVSASKKFGQDTEWIAQEGIYFADRKL